jgi:hypothetical protein
MTNTTPTHSKISRRRFLALVAATGVTAAGAYVIAEAAPWLNYDQAADTGRQPFQMDPAKAAQRRELIRYATLAANGHNTQPWKFALQQDAVEIHPDLTRRLPIVDPENRELWISLGCALENLLVAARATGYAAEVTYPAVTDFIHVRLTADTPQHSPLFDAIPVRQNTRSEYDGQIVPVGDLDQVQAVPLEPGVVLRFVTNPVDKETVQEYVSQGNLNQYADKAFVEELIAWLRFNKREAVTALDGLYTRCSGNP